MFEKKIPLCWKRLENGVFESWVYIETPYKTTKPVSISLKFICRKKKVRKEKILYISNYNTFLLAATSV